MMNRAQDCTEFRAALQQMLDSRATTLPAAMAAHTIACAGCRAEQRAALSMTGFGGPIAPPSDMAERVAHAVLADAPMPATRSRLARLIAVVAVAASLLLALGIGLRLKRTRELPGLPQPGPEIAIQPDPVRLQGDLAAAGSAVESFTRRTADNLKPARKMNLEPPSADLDRLSQSIEPAAQSLTELRRGAASGFEPVASSARRAFSLFFRDSSKNERKPN